MIFVKAEVKDSPLHGKGLFLCEDIPRAHIIAMLTQGTKIMTEQRYQEEQRKGNDIIAKTAIRWIGKLFSYGDSIGAEDYINHSFKPTMMYHCGVCFAARTLKAGEELTADYRFFLAENDVNAFIDGQTGKKVDGLPSKKAFIVSAKKLLRILSTVSDLD